MPSLAVLAITLMDWLHRLGGLGLVLLGVGVGRGGALAAGRLPRGAEDAGLLAVRE